MKKLAWLIRREIWENKAMRVIPAIVGALLVLAAAFGDIDLGPAASLAPPDQPRVCGALVLFGFGVVIFFVMSLYAIWYLLDCLHIERKDRSVLFWRALPVSDFKSVLAKLLTALFIIPMVAFLAADLVTVLMAAALTLRDAAEASSALWRVDNWVQLQALWIYLIAAMAVWYLPVAGWLLLVSAWAKRSVLLWAVMPPLVLYLAERWFLRTEFIGKRVTDRLAGFVPRAFHNNADQAFSLATVVDKGKTSTFPAARTVWELIDFTGFLQTPAVWVGMAMGIALIAAAVEVRRRQGSL